MSQLSRRNFTRIHGRQPRPDIMMKTESHTITSKGYAPLGDRDEYDLDYPLVARNRTSSLSVLSPPRMSKFSSRFTSRRTRKTKLARELGETLTRVRECSPPPVMYQRTKTGSEFEPSRRAVEFVSSWEGVLEEREDDSCIEQIRIRVSHGMYVRACVSVHRIDKLATVVRKM